MMRAINDNSDTYDENAENKTITYSSSEKCGHVCRFCSLEDAASPQAHVPHPQDHVRPSAHVMQNHNNITDDENYKIMMIHMIS